MIDIELREESAAERAAIHALTQRAFEGRPYADGDEGDVIDRLRNAGALLLPLVAVDADTSRIVGQVTFSPATNEGGGDWCALGPVAVEPELQGTGIGGRLIEAGLSRMRASGRAGCILTGDPNYYRRFGFEVSGDHAPAAEPAEYFQLLVFGSARPTGRFAFHPAFYGDPGSSTA